MLLAKVIGNVISTVKHPDYEGQKLLIVQPIDPAGKPKGKSMIAMDVVQAGVGDTVLVLDEGGSGRIVMETPDKRVLRTVIVGIVDTISTE